jgi:hypothetical protein
MKQKAVLTYFRVDINGTDVPMFCESDMSGARTNAFDEEEVALCFHNQELAGTCIVYECHNETCPNKGDEVVLRLGQGGNGIYVDWIHQNPNY